MRSRYIPALLTGIENPIKRCLVPGNKFGLYKGKFDPAWFTDLSMFIHPYMLVSYYYSGKIDNYRETLRIRDDITLLADSGGYSLATKGGSIDVRKVLAWQEKNANIAFSLDLPPAKVDNATRISPGKVVYYGMNEFEKNAVISRNNNLEFMKYRTSDKLKIYNVIHGYNKPTLDLWWDYATRDINFEGYATGLKPANDAVLQAMCVMYLYSRGVRENVHLLGVSGVTVIPLIVWISQYIDKISFDSTSYGYGSRTRAYVYPDRIRDYTHFGRKYRTKKNPMKELYCKCPICYDLKTPDYFIESDITWPGMLISLHNLWCMQDYVKQLDTAINVEHNKEKFISLIRQHTGDWADKTIHAINFVESCLEKGYDQSYEMYFSNHNYNKEKMTRKMIV